MEASPHANSVQFGHFRLDLRAGELNKDGRNVRLQEQPFQILKMLLERPGEVVTREEIRRKLWPNDTIVEFDHSINAAIKTLRRALGDSADDPQYVETVARRGYRLKAPVESPEPATKVQPPEPAPQISVSAGLIGKKVAHYRVLEVLGGGGMGVIYRAEDINLGRPVAIKFLPEELASDRTALERFEREARAASALNHPHICTVHEFGQHEGQSFLVMELLEGQTLEHEITGRPLAVDRILKFGVQIADALEAAHAIGIIHRDIKPANVFITRRGDAKILDFGLAKLTGQSEVDSAKEREAPGEGPSLQGAAATSGHGSALTDPGKVMGTAAYMSPEQVRCEPLDARTDLFSFGLVVYEMTTGQQAFRGETAATAREAILTQALKPVRELNPAVSVELETIIGRALEKDRESRYQSASEMRADLERLKRETDSERVGAGVVPAPAAPARIGGPRGGVRRGRRAGVALVGVALAALLSALIVLNVGHLRDRLLGRAAPPRIQSIAVLPLENLSRDPEQEYFADGMTDELIATLAKIGSLRVISRTSVMRYKGTKKPLPEIARELNVDGIVEGTVQRSGNRMRITAELLHAPTDRHLWADTYESDLGDVLMLQGEVARAIADAIKVKATPQEQARLIGTRAVNPEAYEAYLKGRFILSYSDTRDTRVTLDDALDYFRLALKKDPNYAPAYAGISFVWSGRGGGHHLLPARKAFPEAKAAALKALELDEALADAHAALANIQFYYEWDWAAAEREYKRAIELNPNSGELRIGYMDLLDVMQRPQEAKAQSERALELDPLNPGIQFWFGLHLMFSRQYDAAINQALKLLEVYPERIDPHVLLQSAYRMKGMLVEQIAEEKKAHAGDREYLEALDRGYARGGYREAMRTAADLLDARDLSSGRCSYMASMWAGRNDRAVSCLERSYEERSTEMVHLGVAPDFDPLRSDPRFQALLRRMNFPP